jgi:heat shock protein 4
VNDIAIAVPVWYTEVQRRAVLDAAEILLKATIETEKSEWPMSTNATCRDGSSGAGRSVFAKEFQTKYKIDVMSNKKAVFRLTAAVEKAKKIP